MADQKGCYHVELGDDAGNAGCLDLLNPEGEDLIITRCIVVTDTQATGGARDLNIGVGAEGADNDNVFDDYTATTNTFEDHMRVAGPGEGTAVQWDAAQYLTVTASADPEGQVASLYIEYIRA